MKTQNFANLDLPLRSYGRSILERLKESRLTQAALLAASLCWLIIAGFAFMVNLVGLFVSSMILYLVIDRILGIKVPMANF